jgi:hypothetical protein
MSLLELTILSKSNDMFLRNLSDLPLYIIFDTLWAALNADSKCCIALNYYNICFRGVSISTAELRRPAAQISYLSIVIEFFAIHYNM